MYVAIEEYPEYGKPQVLVQARWIPEETRLEIVSLLMAKFGEKGGPVVYEMTEFCRERLQDVYDSYYGHLSNEEEEKEEKRPQDICSTLEDPNWHDREDNSIEEWCVGEVVMDRKSIFQGLVIEVDDENKVDSLLNALHRHRKIGSATHLIASWRILTPHGHLIQDWDDDGEKGAGQRILQLLVKRDIQNVLLVVCRWFGVE
ncbi:tRNA/rRNA methyltransferase (SpoU) isoform 2 [Galdieria sulphuraria]|uniref:tRNA/rRNA methyltransferase (SpoU) isoform 2 n=1 Tax=Galdieria sulphuraria TaxID=130081 RepID=M2XZ99_GALSU|nr:tRNA/rRNA methyltransferase (SpoU) isoform 2 [Galdieria sulphuraria]EME28973.1 tRNA/rRNA methyltransferase (SpoU) isoform 2 [Galdieria sulphuraria]|eukprot:XP_005705493.1 tRNA/rRNA methyltransferase (SpoU) isoform 2 [Galdieria sulphuraria]